MRNALIGCSGFVGTTLAQQFKFDRFFRSANISDIDDQSFALVVCAAAPAQKWIANKNPQADLDNLQALMRHIETIKCEIFVLISTVDVFGHPVGVDENSLVAEHDLHPYGLHRRRLEVFVQERFRHNLIIRLPGLVGTGLRKNAIFDLLNDNNLDAIDHRAVFQFYPMAYLWRDIETALAAQLALVHLTAEPVSMAEIAKDAFEVDFENVVSGRPPSSYDFQTIYAKIFGREGLYQYTRAQTIDAIRDYARTEARISK